MPTIYYDSLAHALDVVEASKKSSGIWQIFAEENSTYRDQSLTGKEKERGEALDTFVNYCRTFNAPYLQERVQHIAELSEKLQATGLLASSMKRHQVWTRQGSRINPHRVLRGQLSTAWRRTVREQRDSTMGRIAIVLNLAYSYEISATQIEWSAAATLALADLARQAGRSVDVYGVLHGTDTLLYEKTTVLCLHLLSAGQIWSIHNTALTTSPAFLRRLCFRLLETFQPTYGPLAECYGIPAMSDVLRPWMHTVLADHVRLPETAMYLGVSQDSNVRDATSARVWIETQLDQLNS